MAKKLNQSFVLTQKEMLKKRLNDIETCQRLLVDFMSITSTELALIELDEIEELLSEE